MISVQSLKFKTWYFLCSSLHNSPLKKQINKQQKPTPYWFATFKYPYISLIDHLPIVHQSL